MTRMTRPRLITHENALKVMAMLTSAAEQGEPAPTDRAIAEALGGASERTGATMIARLKESGLIRVTSYARARQITITATGQSTRLPSYARSPRDVSGDAGAVTIAIASLAPPPAPLPEPVDRDPCPRCGVRADFGCAHSLRRAA